MNVFRTFQRRVLVLVLVSAAGGLCAVSGCDSSGGYNPPGKLPTTEMTIGARKYTVEVAATDSARERGLMRRDTMPELWGMIFVFKDEDGRSFWMKNTRIPLDILFLDGGGKVVSIHTMKPFDETPTNSKGPAKYAIELNAGQAPLTGVKEGDVLVVPDVARTTKE
jgi:uncharacterized membrane protein (UPF0127 family)